MINAHPQEINVAPKYRPGQVIKWITKDNHEPRYEMILSVTAEIRWINGAPVVDITYKTNRGMYLRESSIREVLKEESVS